MLKFPFKFLLLEFPSVQGYQELEEILPEKTWWLLPIAHSNIKPDHKRLHSWRKAKIFEKILFGNFIEVHYLMLSLILSFHLSNRNYIILENVKKFFFTNTDP